jgi:hypothetical protein
MDCTQKLPAIQAPRPGLFDKLLRAALRLHWPWLQVRILERILRRERRKRGIR